MTAFSLTSQKKYLRVSLLEPHAQTAPRKLICIRAFSVSLLGIILLTSTVISEQQANYQYKVVDPCEYYQQLEFDGNLAYDSVVYQTSLGPRLPGSTDPKN